MKIMLWDFSTNCIELDDISNDNGVGQVNFDILKSLVKSTVFPHHDIYKHTGILMEWDTTLQRAQLQYRPLFGDCSINENKTGIQGGKI